MPGYENSDKQLFACLPFDQRNQHNSASPEVKGGNVMNVSIGARKGRYPFVADSFAGLGQVARSGTSLKAPFHLVTVDFTFCFSPFPLPCVFSVPDSFFGGLGGGGGIYFLYLLLMTLFLGIS